MKTFLFIFISIVFFSCNQKAEELAMEEQMWELEEVMKELSEDFEEDYDFNENYDDYPELDKNSRHKLDIYVDFEAEYEGINCSIQKTKKGVFMTPGNSDTCYVNVYDVSPDYYGDPTKEYYDTYTYLLK